MNEINYKNEIWCGITMELQNLEGNPIRIVESNGPSHLRQKKEQA